MNWSLAESDGNESTTTTTTPSNKMHTLAFLNLDGHYQDNNSQVLLWFK